MAQNRQRYPQQTDKTGKAVVRMVGVVHMIFGTVFALVGLSIFPAVGLFALPFILGGAFFAVNGYRVAAMKVGAMKRAAGEDDDPTHYSSELKFNPPVRPSQPRKTAASGAVRQTVRTAAASRPAAAPRKEEHDHIRPMGDTKESQLEQLKTLKDAGLYTEEEYRQKRAEILSGK